MSDWLTQVRSALSGRYEMERELGRGGMATVMLARDLRHQRPVAIKLLDPELAAAVGVDRFLREIEVVAQLQHPHILSLHDSGEVEGSLYYVMPYVDGGSLRERLQRHGQLPLEEVTSITTQIAGALAYAHSRGVVHRDVKPENIMFSSSMAVLSDFGIARAVVAAEHVALTQTGTVIGTPTYMSPEQATGSSVIDGHSDQYSLACVVYEMLVGQPPFTAPTPQAVIARHTLDVVPSPSIVRNTISREMEGAVLRALAKVPADRFASVERFAEALAAVPEPAEGRRRSEGQRPAPNATEQRGAVRRRVRWGALALVILAAAAALVAGLWRGTRSAASAEQLDPRRIAVLYFRDRSPGGQLGHLADGFTEALIRQLAAVPDLHVVSSGGVAPFRNTTVGIDSVARALGVGTLIEGTVEQSRDKLRVMVSLVNGTDGREVDSKMLERGRSEVFALQDTLAEEIAFFLRQRVGGELQQLQSRRGTTNAAAWELAQRGHATSVAVGSLLTAGDTTAAARELARADSLLAEASLRDRDWVAPVVDRGWLAHQRRNLVGTFDKKYYADWIEKGLVFAEQALRLQADYPDALRLRGTLRYFLFVFNLAPEGTTAAQLLAGAESDLRAGAVATNPNQASAWSLLSHLLMRTGRTPEGKLAAMRAYEADPYLTDAPIILWRLYSSSLDLEDAVEANRWCLAGNRRFPDDALFTECQISLSALPGQRPNVPHLWQLLDQNVRMYPPNAREYRRRRGELLVAMGLVRAGLSDSARSVALRARADATIDPSRDLVYIEAMLRNLMEDRDEALRLLGLWLATNPQDRATQAADSTWWWRGIRDDPRYRALVHSGR